jgi:hypothetical protein
MASEKSGGVKQLGKEKPTTETRRHRVLVVIPSVARNLHFLRWRQNADPSAAATGS